MKRNAPQLINKTTWTTLIFDYYQVPGLPNDGFVVNVFTGGIQFSKTGLYVINTYINFTKGCDKALRIKLYNVGVPDPVDYVYTEAYGGAGSANGCGLVYVTAGQELYASCYCDNFIGGDNQLLSQTIAISLVNETRPIV